MENDKEETLYDGESVKKAISDDEISPEEEGFMQGYNDAIDED